MDGYTILYDGNGVTFDGAWLDDYSAVVFKVQICEKSTSGLDVGYSAAAALFDQIPEYKDAQNLASACREKAKIAQEEETLKHRNEILDQAKQLIKKRTAVDYRKAINILNTISDYTEATHLIQDCKQDIKKLESEEYNYVKQVAARKTIFTIALWSITVISYIVTLIMIITNQFEVFTYFIPSDIILPFLLYRLPLSKYRLRGNNCELVYYSKTRKETIIIESTLQKNNGTFLPLVSHIANYAFFNCKKLDTLILPNTISTIGEKAFINCKELSTIIFYGSMQRWEQIAKYVVFESNKVVIQCNDGRIPHNVIAKWQAEIRNETH